MGRVISVSDKPHKCKLNSIIHIYAYITYHATSSEFILTVKKIITNSNLLEKAQLSDGKIK